MMPRRLLPPFEYRLFAKTSAQIRIVTRSPTAIRIPITNTPISFRFAGALIGHRQSVEKKTLLISE